MHLLFPLLLIFENGFLEDSLLCSWLSASAGAWFGPLFCLMTSFFDSTASFWLESCHWLSSFPKLLATCFELFWMSTPCYVFGCVFSILTEAKSYSPYQSFDVHKLSTILLNFSPPIWFLKLWGLLWVIWTFPIFTSPSSSSLLFIIYSVVFIGLATSSFHAINR